jgi:hypothetical protein
MGEPITAAQIVNSHWWECDGATGGRCYTPVECADMAAAAEKRPPIKQIEVLRLEPGDVLVVKVGDRAISQHAAAAIREHVGRLIPGHEVLVIGEEVSVEVLRP